MFEEEWQVRVSDDVLEVRNPKHQSQRIPIREITGIAIQTSDTGPIGSDVTWFVSDGKSTISFPMGATGEPEILKRFQMLDGFDNEVLINAMGSVENGTFILFNKTKA